MKKMTKSRLGTTALAASAVFAVLAMSGCAADAAAPAPKETVDKVVTLRIAQQAIADFAPIWLGIEQGYFEDEGITLEIVEGGASSAAQIPLLLSGAAELAATTAAAAVQASAQGLEVQIIGGLTDFASKDDLDQSGMLVPAGSAIAGYKDLEGKTVAISGLKSVSEAVISAAVEKEGGDVSKVSFIQAPMPTLGDLVATGGADATFLIDPFLTLAVSSGLTVLGHPFPLVAPGVPGTSIVATAAFAAENPDAIAKFRTALAKAADYATANPDAVVAALSEKAKIPAEMLAGSRNPAFNPVVEADKLGVEAKLLAKYGALDGTVDTTTLVLK
jgi:NitT/TauT family transport system substrate-binding protein